MNEEPGLGSGVPAECPRCGYSLVGILTPAAREPGAAGRCSECGLEFLWINILDESRRDLLGFVEHARGLRASVRAFVTTAAWIVWPWIFWSRVQLHHRIELRRVIVRTGALMLILHGSAGLAWLGFQDAFLSSLAPAPVGPGPGAGVDRSLSLLNGFFWPIGGFEDVGGWWTGTTMYGWVWSRLCIGAALMFVAAAGWPAMWPALPETRRRAKLRWAHLWRAVVYSMWWVLLIEALRIVQGVLLWYGAASGAGFGRMRFFTPYPGSPGASGAVPGPLGMVAMEWADRLEVVIGVIPTAAAVWLALWWAAAIVRGWKIEKGWLVWFLLLVATGLASLIAGLAVSIALHPTLLA